MTESEPEIDVVVEDPRWDALERLCGVAIPAALADCGVSGPREVVVMGCDDTRIAALNGEFRGKEQPTNVLSWPSEERGAETPGAHPTPPGSEPELGDIAIAWETCLREAEEQGKPFDAHVTHLLVHATLHLLGYDHETDADAALMEAAETRILAGLGLPDPYAGP
ncbi:rRNA maturation RNase YbeY [Jannaschia seohaensis]|uniref:Endoribonuclease YbeY n=1 Tax=Jannaschia seohaensis TaxID=475081 RepID=A0A2Y9B8E0_9RHOB|nr:rRNA maturation RNase YbeY [Jannaschia seohaensis]PWJ10348.1 putative rRNA maturation factor [Jannaschia seohaensis]SSA51748.1 probable rRNA maturation factor [Jannaschia seohaensis]